MPGFWRPKARFAYRPHCEGEKIPTCAGGAARICGLRISVGLLWAANRGREWAWWLGAGPVAQSGWSRWTPRSFSLIPTRKRADAGPGKLEMATVGREAKVCRYCLVAYRA